MKTFKRKTPHMGPIDLQLVSVEEDIVASYGVGEVHAVWAPTGGHCS